MVKPGEVKVGQFWKLDARNWSADLHLEITSGPYARHWIQLLVVELIEFIGETMEGPKP